MSVGHVTLLYRGRLASCNYACAYCPFAKQRDSAETLHRDAEEVGRFVDYLSAATARRWSVFFTPRGEALIRPWYQDAVIRLSHLAHVRRIAVQTNLSWPLHWLSRCNSDALGLWCTYHPGQTAPDDFLRRCAELHRLGISYSVGCVGLKEHMSAIEWLRARLPDDVYLWINAYKHVAGYYDAETLDSLAAIDPLFHLDLADHISRGRHCRCGSTTFSISGDGAIRRCHFVDEVLGNLYETPAECLPDRNVCPATTCRCYIGYAHLEDLRLDQSFGSGLLERNLHATRLPQFPDGIVNSALFGSSSHVQHGLASWDKQRSRHM